MIPLLPAPKPKMTFASLFSGVGGFDLGFERAGMTPVGMCELNQQARQVLRHHWKYVKIMEDVRDVNRFTFPNANVLCGGFPCQDVSVAGRRAGLAGERSGLWFEFHRIIDATKPRWVVIENVPGLLSSNEGRDFEVILTGLVNSGYRVSWRILDSQYFGVAQRRRRVFIVASLGNGDSAQVLFESESSAGHIEPSGKEGQGTPVYAIKGAAIGRQPENRPQYGEVTEDGTCYTLNTSEVHAVVGALQARDYKGIGNQYVNEGKVIVGTLAARDYKDAGDLVIAKRMTISEMTDRAVARLDLKRAIKSPPTAFTWHTGNRMSIGDNLAPTMAVSDSTPLAGQQAAMVRRLTPRECERLQSFPDDWTLVNGMSDSARYRMMGNAVTVNVAAWIGKRIMEVSQA